MLSRERQLGTHVRPGLVLARPSLTAASLLRPEWSCRWLQKVPQHGFSSSSQTSHDRPEGSILLQMPQGDFGLSLLTGKEKVGPLGVPVRRGTQAGSQWERVGSQEPRTRHRRGPWWAGFRFSDGVGRGAPAEGNSFQLSFCFSDHTPPPEKGTFPGTCSLLRKRSDLPSARNKDVSMKGLPAVARGGLWVPHFQSRHPVRPVLDAALPAARSSGFGGNKGPLFPSATKAGG